MQFLSFVTVGPCTPYQHNETVSSVLVMSEGVFAAAAAFVSAGKGLSLSDDQRLAFYALYSQVV